MIHFGILAAFLFALAGPGTTSSKPARWLTIARTGGGDVLQADASTLQRSGTQRAVWLRLVKRRPDVRRVKTSTSLVWLDCGKRTYNLMFHRDSDRRGVAVSQRAYGERGKGFEPIAAGTAVDNVARVVCG